MYIGKNICRALLVLAPLALGGCLNVDSTHPAQPASTTVVVPPSTATVMPPTSTTTTTTTICPAGVQPPC
jgi:hypothetical protein